MILAAHSVKSQTEFPKHAEEKSYGYTKKNPIKVGGGNSQEKIYYFLKHLRGPKGQNLKIKRIGVCCEYKNPNPDLTILENGVLTKYSIFHDGLKKPITLYFDTYRENTTFIPSHFLWQEKIN